MIAGVAPQRSAGKIKRDGVTTPFPSFPKRGKIPLLQGIKDEFELRFRAVIVCHYETNEFSTTTSVDLPL
jgi:hypothetical protein